VLSAFDVFAAAGAQNKQMSGSSRQPPTPAVRSPSPSRTAAWTTLTSLVSKFQRRRIGRSGIPVVTGTAQNAQNTLAWPGVSGTAPITYKRVPRHHRRGEGGTAFATNVTSAYINSGLTNGTPYYYRCRQSTPPVPLTSTEVGPLTPQPALPGATTLSGSAGNTSVSLSWTTSSGATSYNIYQNGALKTNVTFAVDEYHRPRQRHGLQLYRCRCQHHRHGAAVEHSHLDPATGLPRATLSGSPGNTSAH